MGHRSGRFPGQEVECRSRPDYSDTWCSSSVLQVTEQPTAVEVSDAKVQQQPVAGLQFDLPHHGGVGEELLNSQGIEATEAGVDDLMAQLAALNK
jgi:hypothetical protein